MRYTYLFLWLLSLSVTSFAQTPEAKVPLFPTIDQVLFQDAAHAYDDEHVVVLSKRSVSTLPSRLVPVRQGDVITVSAYVHYSRGKVKTWHKVGAAAAGLAISSLPYVLDRNAGEEKGADLVPWKVLAPLAGAGVATLPFVLESRRGKQINRATNVKNGLLVPNAYLQYRVYDSKGYLLKTEVQTIDRRAKDAWQPLSVQHTVAQDGYVSVELGNTSRRPVWMDGIAMSTTRQAAPSTEPPVSEGTDGPAPSDTSSVLPAGPITNNACITEPCGDPEDDGGGDDHYKVKGGDGTKNNPYIIGKDVYVLDELTVKPKPVKNKTTSTQPTRSNPSYATGGYDASYHYTYPSGYYASAYGGGGSGGGNPGGGGDPCAGPNRPLDCHQDGDAPNPGQRNWNNLSNLERVQHILKAMKYAQSKGIAVNLNSYFSNLPRTGNHGLGGFYKIKTTVNIDGISIPMSMVIPIIEGQRTFHVTPLAGNDSRVGGDFGSSYYYRFGLNGKRLNTLDIYIPAESEYYKALERFLGI